MLDCMLSSISEDERSSIIYITASMMKLFEIEISASQHRLELISIWKEMKIVSIFCYRRFSERIHIESFSNLSLFLSEMFSSDRKDIFVGPSELITVGELRVYREDFFPSNTIFCFLYLLLKSYQFETCKQSHGFWGCIWYYCKYSFILWKFYIYDFPMQLNLWKHETF